MKKIILALFILLPFAIHAQESLEIGWPKEYHLSRCLSYKDDTTIIDEYAENGKDISEGEIYSIVFTTLNYKATDVIKEGPQDFKDGEIRILGNDSKANHPWVLFTVKDFDLNACSLFYMLVGDQNTYLCQVTVMQKDFPEGFIKKWSEVFRNSEIKKVKTQSLSKTADFTLLLLF